MNPESLPYVRVYYSDRSDVRSVGLAAAKVLTAVMTQEDWRKSYETWMHSTSIYVRMTKGITEEEISK